MRRVIYPSGINTFTFDSLVAAPIQAHVSTRHGGVSPAPWKSLNFSVKRGDRPDRVRSNRARLAEALGFDAADFVFCQQVHGTGIAKVDESDRGQVHSGCDGLITDSVNLPLFLLFADCVPVLLYDPTHHALGVCHAGWRGTVNGAAAATLWAMQAAYGTDPTDVSACIGPSIGPQSYEVGDEVYAMAQARLPGADTLFTYPNGPGSNPYFDLWRANASQLTAAGIPAAQIEIGGVNTARHTSDFFSHRAERGQCGLFSMVAWLD
jgi:YfiH family protein